MACISSAGVTILINCSPSKEFSMSNGLWQGYPLLPFLFIIAAEPLSLMFDCASEQDWLKGVSIGNNDLCFAQQFAYDTLIFCP